MKSLSILGLQAVVLRYTHMVGELDLPALQKLVRYIERNEAFPPSLYGIVTEDQTVDYPVRRGGQEEVRGGRIRPAKGVVRGRTTSGIVWEGVVWERICSYLERLCLRLAF